MILATWSAKTFTRLLAATLIVLAVSGYAFAARCTVSATGINFGSYNILSAAPTDSTGQVNVSCNGNVTSAAISISASPTSGSFWPRDMRSSLSPSFMMAYNLYTDSTRSTVWGDGTLGTQTVVIQPVTRKAVYTETIYARIPARQDVYYGPYSDTLTVTVNW
ncbi:MAG: spore coat U domain-containing protein [Actinomycetota bacterium]|nr:spore coat U domain-containing protein [Actinomycetota bacterium]